MSELAEADCLKALGRVLAVLLGIGVPPRLQRGIECAHHNVTAGQARSHEVHKGRTDEADSGAQCTNIGSAKCLSKHGGRTSCWMFVQGDEPSE